MYDYQKYLTHSMGMSNLINWLGRWYRFNHSYDINESFIHLGSLVSGRFGIGIPKSKSFGKNLFLAIQPEEQSWINAIKWDRCVLKEEENRLYLVSKRIDGDMDKLPDIPAFSISLLFDSSDKIDLIKSMTHFDFRELWYEDGENENDDKIEHISRGCPLFTLPLIQLAVNTPVFSTSETVIKNTFEELLNNKINKTNSYNEHYEGSATKIVNPDLQFLIQEFDNNKIAKVSDTGEFKKTKK